MPDSNSKNDPSRPENENVKDNANESSASEKPTPKASEELAASKAKADSLARAEADAVGRPTQDELVTQLKESDESERGPNATLRHHIELYSQYGPLLRNVGRTLIGAIYVPAILAFIAFQLWPAYDYSTLQGAVFKGLVTLVAPLFVALLLSRTLRPRGLAEKHFGWSSLLCKGLRQLLWTMIWIWLPLRFLYNGLESFAAQGATFASDSKPGYWSDSLGRLLFIAAMFAMTLGSFRAIQTLRRWIAENEATSESYDSLRGLLLWFLPLMPASLLALSIAGYHFTAVQISWRTMWTILLMIGISMAGGLLSRMLLIAQFGIKLRELDRYDDGQIKSDESIDISAISQQVNRLLRATALVAMVVVGWQIWSTVLPAIDYLETVRLWWGTEKVDGLKVPITLKHLLIAMGVLIISFILSRNLPGLLEITLLDRLPLDRGGRYAISFVVRYIVAICGVLAAFQIVGFSWASVQWLAAALTLGLGFGLQEIFANVASGLIILIERPVRVGDVVTVNGVTGTVTRMQLRATTIKDLDFRELIVPNKTFITEDVMNWTLTDRTSRIVMTVGVAYGSDTDLVQSTLMKIASRHPLVQTDPAPEVYFKEFGASSLDFELRAFIATREIFVKVRHELNMAIDAAFRAKGIEIAFPQQDIYIKNLKDLNTGRPEPDGGKDGGKDSTGTPVKAGFSSTPANPKKGAGPKAEGDLGDEGVPVSDEDRAAAAAAKLLELQREPISDALVQWHLAPDQTIGESIEEQQRRVVRFPLKQIRGQADGVVIDEDKKAS